jgi:hypothetical protein
MFKTKLRADNIRGTVAKIYFRIFVRKTNSIHYLSLIYFVTQPLYVSGICCQSSGGINCIMYGNCYVLYVSLTVSWPDPVS